MNRLFFALLVRYVLAPLALIYMLAPLALIFPLASAYAVPDPLADLDAMLARQKAEDGACNKFRKKWKSMVKGGLTRESPSHVSRQQSNDALKLLEKFPFRDSAQSKVWAYFVEGQATLAQVPDQKALLDRLARAEPPCEVFSRSVHRELLLKDVAALGLTKKEAREVARMARDFLQESGNAATMSGLGMKIRFLRVYLDAVYREENGADLQSRAEALQKEFDAGRDQAQIERQQLSAASKADTLAYWAPEFGIWQKEYGTLSGIVSELKF